MADQVREGRLDLAFVALPGRSSPGLELTPLRREPIALVLPAGHRFAARASVELAELQEETMIDLPTGWGTRTAIDRSFAAAGVRRTIAFEVNDTASVIEFIQHGLAVGLLPPSFVDGIEGIVTVPIRHYVPHFEPAVATPSNRPLSAAARTLLETIKTAGGG